MKFKILLYLSFLTITTYSQVTEGVITYKIYSPDGEKKVANSAYLNQKALSLRKELTFSLSFNKNEAFFKADDLLKTDANDYNDALISCGALGEFTKNFKNKTILRYRDFPDFGKIAIKTTNPIKWEMLNEKKMINGYECYLAKGKYLNYDYQITEVPITAWYCPKIPVSIGPKNYDGLPGLIMELTDRYGTFGASIINLNKKYITPNFKKEKYKIITDQEYSDLIKKLIDGK